jgi:hypothetical protein
MANESKSGHNAKVTLGATQIIGIGSWGWSGCSVAMLDDTEFGDNYDDYVAGLVSCGEVTFNGNFKKDDTTGQNYLKSCFLNRLDLTSLRLYVDQTSYYTPNNTTAAGGGIPGETPIGHVKIKSCDISFDKGALGTISFTAQVCAAPLRLI